jgi:MFS-type transporter involved in bile tolerance (Atg22 family)
LPQEWIGIATHLKDANLITVGIGISSIVILLTVKEFIEPKLKEKFNLKVPIPIDIIIVCFIMLSIVKLDFH